MTRLAWRALGAALICVASASGLSGCTSVRNGLGTRDGICFSALPAARELAGSEATFAGVRYLPPESLVASVDRVTHRHITLPPSLERVSRQPECIVAFSGATSVRLLPTTWRPEEGADKYTVIVVRQSDDRVLGVAAFPGPPLRFAHLS